MFRQHVPETSSEVLTRCREGAATGHYAVSNIAHARLQAARLSPADLRQILATADRCEPHDGDGRATWRVHGSTIDGAKSEAIVTFDAGGLTVL